jgi:hypothetical protein
MKFKEYLVENGKSEKTAANYDQAVSSSMSSWVQRSELFEGKLDEIASIGEFDEVVARLEMLDEYIEKNKKGKGMYQASLRAFRNYLLERQDISVIDDIKVVLNDTAVPETEKSNLIKSRIGQGVFRSQVLECWDNACAVTGYPEPMFLVASHIKPWRTASNSERLNRYNGLMLVPNLDKAFDKGLITFAANGEIVISNSLPSAELLGIEESMTICLQEEHKPFMDYHHEHVYENSI